MRASETKNKSCVATHDHSQGPCDLPDDPAVNLCLKNRNGKMTACMWWPAEGAVWGKGSGCCSRCADQDGRKAKRRKDRHDTRRSLLRANSDDL